MSLFEDYLTFGRLISQEEKFSLYKYLLIVKADSYQKDAIQLLREKFLIRSIADGVISYQMQGDYVSYSCKKVSEDEFSSSMRTIKMSIINSVSISRLIKFFAQVEVDVLSNYPLPSKVEETHSGFGLIVYPYYDLNYYSNGEGKVKGLIKKLRSKEDPLLNRLLAS